MPEELAIALILLVFAGWLAFKVLETIMKAVSESSTRCSVALSRFSASRRAKRRALLAPRVTVILPRRLESAEKRLEITRSEFQRFTGATKWIPASPEWTRVAFPAYEMRPQSEEYAPVFIDLIPRILTSNSVTWAELERKLIDQDCNYPFPQPQRTTLPFVQFPTLELDLPEATIDWDSSVLNRRQLDRYFLQDQQEVAAYNERRLGIARGCELLNSKICTWNHDSRKAWERYADKCEHLFSQEVSEYKSISEQYQAECSQQKLLFRQLLADYSSHSKSGVIGRFRHVLDSIRLPEGVPHSWELDFDEKERILIVEIALPDVVYRPPLKRVNLKNSISVRPASQADKKVFIPRIHPAILLRVAYEIFQNDIEDVIKLLVINGWVRFDDPRTGADSKAYTASLVTEKNGIVTLDLQKIDPLHAFESLQGKSAGRLIEIVPIDPILSLNRKDRRFVEARAVLDGLGSETNLAAMDWQKFEHLIRELFEKEFAQRGAEVKITQASRDRGVDAVIFVPDPIHGGKYVVQAKRYTNTVDVSAVRDLCAVVKKEGASRGILVTTSTYGADAYSFANNEPVTLLNGAELLGLLKKHGYEFRINLQEARRLASSL